MVIGDSQLVFGTGMLSGEQHDRAALRERIVREFWEGFFPPLFRDRLLIKDEIYSSIPKSRRELKILIAISIKGFVE